MADHAANVAMDLRAHRAWPLTEHNDLDAVLPYALTNIGEWAGSNDHVPILTTQSNSR
ncbi:TPA: hypothetical protein N0F65_011704 [Lagenidium giganteum]|uniref:Uncharacterized protein n=1 Tax=Lagenidium giganteum TaxID=4803 RepID=A0AAV2YV84_9STRA|nr:TPA: hypothetical protein N0F65_011704 [Lagenidium giganteum]